MSMAQALVLTILLATMAMFLWGRWRHDLVALASLLASVAAGLVPANDAFAGFGHPAVITVACVLVLSHALQSTGAVDLVARRLLPVHAGPSATILSLSTFVAVLSAFMNNIGALALMMPIVMQASTRLKLPPGRVLMPVAFASLLGGMTTLIGTPPNLVVSGFRDSAGAGSFSMFDFSPVGLAVAVAGLVFIAAFGWRLVPARDRRGVEGFETAAYLTEARVPEGAKAAGLTLREIETILVETDAQVIGLVRDNRRIAAPHPFREVHSGDVLVIEAEPAALSDALASLGLVLEEDVPPADEGSGSAADPTDQATTQVGESGGDPEAERGTDGSAPAEAPSRAQWLQTDDVILMELAVRPRAEIVGFSATDIRLRTRFGINLLAISREGRHFNTRLRSTPLRAGDVILMQGTPDAILEFASRFGCVPLAGRPLRLPERRKALVAGLVMMAAIAGAAFGLVPAAIAFAAGVLAVVVLGVLPVRRLYDAIDWSIVVLLGALIPIAGAMATTGTAELIARILLDTLAAGNAVVALALILIVTMILSDFMNNAATAAVMCPIAIGAATGLGVNADPFLMAVAIGASCAFLTPIGHQNNTLILGPGGFRFGDYWKLGLPLEVVVVMVAIPALLWIWPL